MTQNFQERGKMLLSAAILLLGCSSALADGHANNMGCCEYKLVPGSMPKSGHYFLDTQPSDIIPDFCKDSCVYVKERMPGDDPLPEGSRFCFKPSSTYTAECQDTGDGSIAIDSSSVTDSSGIEIDSPEMKPDSEPVFNTAKECKFGELGLLTPETDGYTSYTIKVDVSDYTIKEGGLAFAAALDVQEVDSGSALAADVAKDLTVRLLEMPDVVFYCAFGDGFGAAGDGFNDIGCFADEEKPIPPMVYNLEVKVSSEIAMPIVKSLIFGGNDVCQDHTVQGSTGDSMEGHEDSHGSENHESTAAGGMEGHGSEDHEGMEGHGNAKCTFTENVEANGQSYTIETIKTAEAGIWKFVFDKNEMMAIDIVGGANQNWLCVGVGVGVGAENECTNGNIVTPAGTYTVKFSSVDGMTPWGASVPLIKTFKVGDKDQCEKGDEGHNGMADHNSMEDHSSMENHDGKK